MLDAIALTYFIGWVISAGFLWVTTLEEDGVTVADILAVSLFWPVFGFIFVARWLISGRGLW